MKHRLVVATVALTLVAGLAGCGGGGGSDAKNFTNGGGGASGEVDKPTDTTAPDLTVDDTDDTVDGPDFEDVNPETPEVSEDMSDDDVYLAALDDIQDFWSKEYKSLYFNSFQKLPSDRIMPIAPGGDSGDQLCNGEQVTYDIVQDNAVAFDCQEGQLVAWDDDGLLKDTSAEFGPLASSAILAHEFGHVIQYQSGGQLGTPYSELQADCFAGAWVANVSANPPDSLQGFSDPSVVDATLSAMLTLRDPVGFDPAEEGAHGNGFDRVRVFQDGFEKGPEECASYDDSPPTTTEIPFTSQEDFDSGGNLDFETLLPAATADLDNYYGILVEGWQPLGTLEPGDLDSDTADLLTNLNDSIGDGAPLVFLGIGWAQSLQQLLGADEGRDEQGQLLQAVCIAGDWMAHMFYDVEGDTTFGDLQLSPGDLDEAILGIIQVSTGSDDTEPGSVFELLSAYRQGVLQRIGSCGL